MSGPPGGGLPGDGLPGGGQPRDETGSFGPGLDHLIRALTVSGHPHEQAGRDAVLAAFRAASRQPRRAGFRGPRMLGSGAHEDPGRPRRPRSALLPARLAAASAAGLVALGGVVAAAYAQALPAPVQQVAHSVFAPFGVPASEPASAGGPASAGNGAVPSAAARPSPTYPVSVKASGGASGQALPAAPALGADHYVITLAAGRAEVPAGGLDLFTGKVSHLGGAASGINVRLLERVAGSSGWQTVAAGVTGSRGGVRIWGPSMTASAAFRLAGPAGARSAPVRVTVIRPVRLRLVSGQLKDHLIVAAPDAAPGATVDLMVLVNGAWERVASKPLGLRLRADFALPAAEAAGYFYRASLTGPAAPASATSNRVWIPRRSGTGALSPEPARSGPGGAGR